jgi:hypothetical protein
MSTMQNSTLDHALCGDSKKGAGPGKTDVAGSLYQEKSSNVNTHKKPGRIPGFTDVYLYCNTA